MNTNGQPTYTMRTSLYPYQEEGVDMIDGFRGRCLLADQMGLGKSIQSLTWAIRNRSARPIVIVCPAGIKYVWEAECLKHFGLRAEVLQGMTPKNHILTDRQPMISIINYTILGAWMKFLKELKPQLVIVDECQSIKDSRTLQSRNVKELCRDVPYVLALSGTPLVNRPAELFPVLNLLKPKVFPSFWNFAHEFTQPQLTPYGWSFKGSKNLDVLHKRMRGCCMVRRRKFDVLSQLPPMTRQVVAVDLDPKDRREYDHAVEDFLGWLQKEGGPGKVRTALRAQAVTRIGYLRRLAASLKKSRMVEWINQFQEDAEEDEKLIVFGIHKEVLDHLHQKYRKQCVLVDGSVPVPKRKELIYQFLNNKQTRICLGNIQAAGSGWSALGVAQTLFVELGWTPGEMLQAEKRTEGIGRGKEGVASTATYLVARNTIETDMAQLLMEKMADLDSVLDGDPQATGFDLIDLLIRNMGEGK